MRDRFAFGAAAVGALAAILIWTLWVLPISRSVGDAHPAPIGDAVTIELDAGEGSGIWGSGRSTIFGTVDCRVTSPGGAAVAQGGAPSLNWDDTLWWMTPRPGFEQFARFTAAEAGDYRIRCADSLETYDGEFLVAGDSFGAGSIGLGRTGSNGFATGTLLAFGAVVLPLFSVLVVIVVSLRRLGERSRARRLSRSAFEAP